MHVHVHVAHDHVAVHVHVLVHVHVAVHVNVHVYVPVALYAPYLRFGHRLCMCELRTVGVHGWRVSSGMTDPTTPPCSSFLRRGRHHPKPHQPASSCPCHDRKTPCACNTPDIAHDMAPV